MKTSIHILTALGIAALIGTAAAQNNNGDQAAPPPLPPQSDNGNAAPPDNGTPAAPQLPDQAPPAGDQAAPAPDTGAPVDNGQRTSTTIQPTEPLGSEHAKITSEFTPPDAAGTNANPDDLSLNFKNAPVDMVLNYLSDAAGFIIVLDTRVGGTVNVTGKHLTKDEAVDLLNSVLNQNGYAAIRDGRTLTIVSKEDAKTRHIPVKSGNDPAGIPNNDEIVTQIIPIRFVEARQLVSDLSSFVSPQATVVANEAGNSIVITDTQSNIRHIAEIIKAVDDSAEAETEIRVFKLQYANPNDVASELSSVFPTSGSGGNTQSPIRFGGGLGGGGFFQRMMGGGAPGGAAAAGGSDNDRIKKATQVSAVADQRIQAVIVTAPKELMSEIADMMKELDVTSDRDQGVYVFKMNNGDPQQALTVLQSMFQSSSSSRSGGSSSASTSALLYRQQNNAQTTGQSSGSSGFGSGSGGGLGGGGGRTGGF
ncbi:MAG TPA: secretin N-terminal domain-containing protein [Candidatus Sulfotelmatobacter sp.]|jgi:general secretion pathway protein D|nr:secretin N-terminal domain-containing protein [Candidatus Sulfotelmatobacter sp.]